MTRHLYFVRHAETHEGHHYNTDMERELKPAGMRQARQIGNYLNESKDQIELILSSDAQRAKSTAQLIAHALNYSVDKIKLSPTIYSGSMHDLLRIIQEIPESIQQVLLVGHNPTLLELINLLSDIKKQSMSPCELVKLSASTNWNQVNKSGLHVVSGYRSPHL